MRGEVTMVIAAIVVLIFVAIAFAYKRFAAKQNRERLMIEEWESY